VSIFIWVYLLSIYPGANLEYRGETRRLVLGKKAELASSSTNF